MNLSNYSEYKPHRVKFIMWRIIYFTLFRIAAGRPFKWFRHGLLRIFGAQIDKEAYIYSSCDIYMPWNFVCGRACLGPKTSVFNKDVVTIGDDSVVSQGSFVCTASHDINSLMLPLVTAPITIGDKVWIAADAFVGMGVTIGEGAVVGARACVFKDVAPWTVVGGNPAKFIKNRMNESFLMYDD